MLSFGRIAGFVSISVILCATPSVFSQEAPTKAAKVKPDGKEARKRMGLPLFARVDAKEYARLITQSKDPLVRKHAALALAGRRSDANAVAPDLRAALKAEMDKDVKKALEIALERIDPPLEKLSAEELASRLSMEQGELKTRQQIVKALGQCRDPNARRVLEGLLLDEELASDAAAALEVYNKHSPARFFSRE